MPLRAVQNFQDSVLVRVADVVIATGAISYPWWRAILHEWSAIASDIAPFLALAWFLVQIFCRVWVTAKYKKDS